MVALRVSKLEDPAQVLAEARTFLLGEPVLHNLVLTLLEARRRWPQPGRYWVAWTDSYVTGVAFQSPESFEATVTPMSPDTARAVAEAVAAEAPSWPGVNGEAATTALIAGQWAESTKRPAVPWQGQRLYEARAIRDRQGVSGALRQAGPADRDLLLEWVGAFHDEATPGEPGRPEAVVDARLPAGHMWVWDDGEPRSMTTLTPPVAGVVRVQAVFTPRGDRGRGYAGSLVSALSEDVLAKGNTPALYTDLGNPASNSVYRRIGYRCVAEIVRYRLG